MKDVHKKLLSAVTGPALPFASCKVAILRDTYTSYGECRLDSGAKLRMSCSKLLITRAIGIETCQTCRNQISLHALLEQ